MEFEKRRTLERKARKDEETKVCVSERERREGETDTTTEAEMVTA